MNVLEDLLDGYFIKKLDHRTINAPSLHPQSIEELLFLDYMLEMRINDEDS